MFFVSNKRFEKLERRIRDLETEVSDMKEKQGIRTLIPSNVFWGFGPPPKIATVDAVELILEYLGLKIKYKPSEGEQFLLETKNKKIKTKR